MAGPFCQVSLPYALPFGEGRAGKETIGQVTVMTSKSPGQDFSAGWEAKTDI